MPTEMQEHRTSRVYDAWAGMYDATFGRLVHKRQVVAVEHLRATAGDTILDIGVGTGGTLPHYPHDVTVLAMDLSAGMLAMAARKRRELGLHHCHLVQADAMQPPFAVEAFDKVMISHTVSVVSDPPGLMRSVAALVKPEGKVVVLNHFRSGNRVIGAIERLANPLCVRLGWRSDLSLAQCLQGSGLEVDYMFKLTTVDLWQIVVLRRTARLTESQDAKD